MDQGGIKETVSLFCHMLMRLAFFLWIMDCGFVMYFGDRPNIPIYEIRHTVQCHEDIWWAKTDAEWAELRQKMGVNDAEFPLLMSMLISPDISIPPTNLSVLGGFDLLHGLHIHIWIQQQYEASIGENATIRQVIFRKRNEEVQTALRKWREGWESTLTTFPSLRQPLYQRAALAFWFLAKYFNEVKDSRHQPGFCGAIRQILPVGRLLRAIFMMIDNGKLSDNSPASAIHPSEEEDSNLRGNASLDTMNINFIMYEKRDEKIPG